MKNVVIKNSSPFKNYLLATVIFEILRIYFVYRVSIRIGEPVVEAILYVAVLLPVGTLLAMIFSGISISVAQKVVKSKLKKVYLIIPIYYLTVSPISAAIGIINEGQLTEMLIARSALILGLSSFLLLRQINFTNN